MRILFVTSRPPWPVRRGDQARAAGWVETLAARHKIAVVAQAPPGFPASPFPPGIEGRVVPIGRFDQIRSLTHAFWLPGQVALHHHRLFADACAAEIERFRPQVVVPILSRVAAAVGDARGVPVVLDLVDSLELNMAWRGAREWWLRPAWRWEAQRIGRWDCQRLAGVAAALVVSDRDRAAIAARCPRAAAAIRVMPFGLRTTAEMPRAGPDRRPVVLLSGNLGYFPTHDGARWFATEVWPRVRRGKPDAEWWLAGSRAGRGIRRLGRLPGVEILSDPADLDAIRACAAVAIAPLRAGSGTAIKILESMAAGLPVVTTPEGAAGLDATRGDEVAIAGDAPGFAAAVLRLLEDRAAAARQTARAWAWLRQRHDLETVARRFETLLETVVAKDADQPR